MGNPPRVRPCSICRRGVEWKPGRGRPPSFCSWTCEKAARRIRRQVDPERRMKDSVRGAAWREANRNDRLVRQRLRWRLRHPPEIVPAFCPGCQTWWFRGPRSGSPKRALDYFCRSCSAKAAYRFDRQDHPERYSYVPRPLRAGRCKECGGSFERPGGARYCGPACRDRAGRRSAEHRRRRSHRERIVARGDRFTTLELAERDRWRCHLCGRKVWRDDWSIDHLVPICAGGLHTWDNVALAHWICNVRRGARPLAEVV